MQKTMQFPDDDPQTMQSLIHRWCEMLASLPVDRQVNEINSARKEMHLAGPFASEPVDLVLWAKNTLVCANDYNPNTVAPPEMELLRLSITADGYTQPIVSWMNSGLHEGMRGCQKQGAWILANRVDQRWKTRQVRQDGIHYSPQSRKGQA